MGCTLLPTRELRRVQWGPRGLLRTIRIARRYLRGQSGFRHAQGMLSEGTTTSQTSQTGGGALNIPTLGLSLVPLGDFTLGRPSYLQKPQKRFTGAYDSLPSEGEPPRTVTQG